MSFMQDKAVLKLMLWFTIGYLAIFTILAIINKNYEFLYYTFILSALILIIVLYHKKIHLSKSILFGLTILGVMHIFGGNIHILGTRLYDIWLIQPNILKYDNIVHAFGIFVTTFVAYSFIHPHLDKKINHNAVLLSLILVSMAMGIGAFNEILELIAVVFLGAAKQVGDYINNALDLVFNLCGSIIACFFIIRYHWRKK
jgi:hypothetical protein